MDPKEDPPLAKEDLKEVEIFGFRFYIYPERYRPGIESRIPRGRDIATLANEEGYYFCTLYGVDNLRVPFLVNYLQRLKEIELKPELTELLELARMAEKKGWMLLDKGKPEDLERVEKFERLRSIEEVVFKSMLIRRAVEIASKEGNLILIAGSEKRLEEQKLRRLGNGFAVYLSEKVRKMAGIEMDSTLKLRVVDGRIVIEKATG